MGKPVFCDGMPLGIDEQGNVVVKLPWERLVGRDLIEYTRVVFVFGKRGRILIIPVPKELEGLPDGRVPYDRWPSPAAISKPQPHAWIVPDNSGPIPMKSFEVVGMVLCDRSRCVQGPAGHQTIITCNHSRCVS
jgi:hypothetical protein